MVKILKKKKDSWINIHKDMTKEGLKLSFNSWQYCSYSPWDFRKVLNRFIGTFVIVIKRLKLILWEL